MQKLNETLIDYIVEKAKSELNPRAVFLFGSRASGLARPHSDYDFAFDIDESISSAAWAKFFLEVQEDAPTLLALDTVNMNEIDINFKKKILKDGIILYKRESHGSSNHQ